MTQKFVAFSCTHCPLEDEAAVAFLLENLIEEEPDLIVHLGDGHQAESASKWPTEYTFTQADEYAAHNEFLRRIRVASPDSRKVFIPGNHDWNIIAMNRVDPKLRDLVSWQRRENEPELYDYWEKPTEYVYDRNRGVFRAGQVTFAHGFEASQSSDEMQAYNLGLPYGLTVLGHTHRPTPVTQGKRVAGVPLPYWYANAGCLLDMDVEYMRRNRRHLWGQAVVVGTFSDWRYEKTLMPQSPQWEAETRIFRMYNDV